MYHGSATDHKEKDELTLLLSGILEWHGDVSAGAPHAEDIPDGDKLVLTVDRDFRLYGGAVVGSCYQRFCAFGQFSLGLGIPNQHVGFHFAYQIGLTLRASITPELAFFVWGLLESPHPAEEEEDPQTEVEVDESGTTVTVEISNPSQSDKQGNSPAGLLVTGIMGENFGVGVGIFGSDLGAGPAIMLAGRIGFFTAHISVAANDKFARGDFGVGFTSAFLEGDHDEHKHTEPESRCELSEGDCELCGGHWHEASKGTGSCHIGEH